MQGEKVQRWTAASGFKIESLERVRCLRAIHGAGRSRKIAVAFTVDGGVRGGTKPSWYTS